MEWLTVNDFKRRIEEYHLQNEGHPTELINYHAAVYSELENLKRNGIVDKSSDRRGGQYSYRFVSNNIHQRLLQVIRDEIQWLNEEITSLQNRKSQLQDILNENE